MTTNIRGIKNYNKKQQNLFRVLCDVDLDRRD